MEFIHTNESDVYFHRGRSLELDARANVVLTFDMGCSLHTNVCVSPHGRSSSNFTPTEWIVPYLLSPAKISRILAPVATALILTDWTLWFCMPRSLQAMSPSMPYGIEWLSSASITCVMALIRRSCGVGWGTVSEPVSACTVVFFVLVFAVAGRGLAGAVVLANP